MVCSALKRIKDSVQHAQALRSACTDVSIIAVSKGQPIDRIAEAISCGQMDFGENRVQEGIAKFSRLREASKGLQLHLIGPLQTNKVKLAVAHFDVIQSLDRPNLAEELVREMSKQGRCLPCFIQVNTGHEPQKAGVLPAQLEGLYGLCYTLGLNVTGLMCIPPVAADAAQHFDLLASLAKGLALRHLSMGMSADYQIAVAHGATHIRVGTALFGQRDQA